VRIWRDAVVERDSPIFDPSRILARLRFDGAVPGFQVRNRVSLRVGLRRLQRIPLDLYTTRDQFLGDHGNSVPAI
jgi:hypothetical protein